MPGNTCAGGNNFHPIRIQCPGQWSLISFKSFFFIVVLGLGAFFGIPFLKSSGLLDSVLGLTKGGNGPDRSQYKKDFSDGGDLNLNMDDDEEDGIIRLGDPKKPERRQGKTNENNDEGGLLEEENELMDMGTQEEEDLKR